MTNPEIKTQPSHRKESIYHFGDVDVVISNTATEQEEKFILDNLKQGLPKGWEPLAKDIYVDDP